MLRTVVVEESSWAWECSGRCDEINNVVDRQKGGKWWVVSGRSSSWQSELRTRARLEPTLALTDHTTPALGLLYVILHTSKRVQ